MHLPTGWCADRDTDALNKEAGGFRTRWPFRIQDLDFRPWLPMRALHHLAGKRQAENARRVRGGFLALSVDSMRSTAESNSVQMPAASYRHDMKHFSEIVRNRDENPRLLISLNGIFTLYLEASIDSRGKRFPLRVGCSGVI